jgi:cutinase
VLSGYSQGGYAVHNAAYQLSADAMSKVKAVVVFGDPMSKVPVAGIDPHRVLIVCHKGDNICRHEGPFVTPQHLTYADDARDAAQFLVSRLS